MGRGLARLGRNALIGLLALGLAAAAAGSLIVARADPSDCTDEVYNSPYADAVLNDGASAYFRLDEASGPSMCAEYYNQIGTYNASGISYGVQGAIDGDPDTAVSADGTPGVIGVGGSENSGVSANSSFTLQGWFRSTGTTQNQALVAIGGTQAPGAGAVVGLTTWSDHSCGSGVSYPSTLGLDEYTLSNCWNTETAGVNLYDGNWHQLVVTYSANTNTSEPGTGQVTGYVDGQSLGSQTAAASINLTANQPILIGRWVDTSVNKPFIGDADEVAVYPTAISAAQVAQQYDIARQPVVSGVKPVSGSPIGGTSVTITGEGFTHASSVDFGSTAATSFTVDSDTQITATAPAGTGTVDVTVTTPEGTSPTSAADRFSYVAIAIGLSQSGQTPQTEETITSTPCSSSSTTVTIDVTHQNIPGASTLSVSSTGDTAGLSASLSSTSLPDDGSATLTLTRVFSQRLLALISGNGTATYTITATDGSYPPATATLVVNRAGELTAQGIYVTQGTQSDPGKLLPSGTSESGDAYAGVLLVAGKTTVVRLYADSADPAGLPGVDALLYGYRGGHELPGSPLAPDYGPETSSGAALTALPDADASSSGEMVSDQELTSGTNAYTFTLPASWETANDAISGGLIQLVGQVVAGTLRASGGAAPGAAPHRAGRLTSACAAAASFTLNGIEFHNVGRHFDATVTPVAMTVGGVMPPPPAEVFQDAGAVTPLRNGALGTEPYFGRVDITDIAHSTQYPCNLAPSASVPGTTLTAHALCLSNENGDVLSRLESYDPGSNGHVVGVTLGTAYGDTASVPGHYSVVNGTNVTAAARPLSSVTHELFHQFGLVHASDCGGGGANGQVAETWPPDQKGYLNGVGLDPLSEPYQFIAAGVRQTLDGTTYQGGPVYDFMSYCAYAGQHDAGDWVSPRNWTQLISNFGISNPAAADVASPSAAGQAPDAGSALAPDASTDPAKLTVSGFVTPAGVNITNIGPQVGAPAQNGTSAGSITLTSRGSRGQVLSSVRMAGTTGGHIDLASPANGRQLDGMTGMPLSMITGEVPAAGVKSIQISDDGTVLLTRTRPAKAPDVTVLSPRAGARVGGGRTVLVRWRATNPEHLSLTAMIDYSRDGGRTWRTIFVGPDTGHVSLESFFLTASRDARLRVRVNDGFNETAALSGVFTALGAPPQVTILTEVAPRMLIPGDSRPQLSGAAVDQDALTLSGGQLKWFDGPFLLGSGSQIGAGPLPAGVNHIRLVARDPEGQTASAGLTVKVAAVTLPFLKLTIPRHVSAAARILAFRASSSITAQLTISGHNVKLGKRPKTFRLTIGRGRASILLELSVTADGIPTPFAVEVTR